MSPHKDEEGNFLCRGCRKLFSSHDTAKKHERGCEKALDPIRRLMLMIPRMFMERHGLDRRLRLTKMFEYLYYRYLLNVVFSRI